MNVLLSTGQNLLSVGQNNIFVPISVSQIMTTSSKIDIVLPTSQNPTLFAYGILAEVPVDPIVTLALVTA